MASGHRHSSMIPPRPWLPERVSSGQSVAEALPTAMHEFGMRRAFLMVSRSLRNGTEVVEDVARSLGEECVGIFDGMPPHTPRAEVLTCAERVKAVEADVVVTIG